MVLLCFLNNHDKNSFVMGRNVSDYLKGKGDYAKIFTRYQDSHYEECPVKDTLVKIKEHAQIFDSIVVSFGLRLFPSSAYKDIMDKYKDETSNLVFLKELKGSKTWTISDNKLDFQNTRIADSGVFIFQSKDVLASKTNNFNGFIKDLIKQGKLKHEFVNYWLFTNKYQKSNSNKKRRGVK